YSINISISKAHFFTDEYDPSTGNVLYSNVTNSLDFSQSKTLTLTSHNITESFNGSTFITGNDPKSVTLNLRYYSSDYLQIGPSITYVQNGVRNTSALQTWQQSFNPDYGSSWSISDKVLFVNSSTYAILQLEEPTNWTAISPATLVLNYSIVQEGPHCSPMCMNLLQEIA
nr:hypothetical protein [Nitrososphaerota archaeon]